MRRPAVLERTATPALRVHLLLCSRVFRNREQDSLGVASIEREVAGPNRLNGIQALRPEETLRS
jgi:hypothetical protein